METNKNPKNPKKFECKYCNYITSSKKDYEKHKLTRKHLKETGELNMETTKNPQTQPMICDICGKIYKTRTGLWKHKKLCTNSKEIVDNKEIVDKKEEEFGKGLSTNIGKNR